MEELNSAIEAIVTTNPLVGYWMNWMMLITAASVLFVWKRIPARLALGSLFIIFPLSFLIYTLWGEVHLIGISHLLVWGPLAVYFAKLAKDDKINFKSCYGVWFGVFLATIIIVMLFDVRDIYLVLTGGK